MQADEKPIEQAPLQLGALPDNPASAAMALSPGGSTATEDQLQLEPPASKPDHGTYYYKAFWGAYKGHVRGMLRGLVVGAIAGLAVGLGLAGLFAIGVLGHGIAWGAAAMLISAFTGVGAVVGSELMGKVGNTAGNAAAIYAETEMRLRYPALPEVSPDSPPPGFGHHFEVPPDKDYSRIFHKQVALPGLLFGTAVGALLAFGGAGGELLGHFSVPLLESIGIGAQALVVGAGSLFGLSFSINRGLLKSLFNWSDNLLMGRVDGPSKEAMARDQARYKTQDPDQPYAVTGAQRHDEYQRLLNGYFKKCFSASWAGDRRGFLGGIFGGTLSGSLAGLMAGLGVAALTTAGGGAALLVIGLFTALGGRLGMHIFSDSGREAAAFAAAKELYNERIKGLKQGEDITFDVAEQRACERATHHPDMDPPEAEQKTWFNWKRALIGLAAGALIGAVLTPLVFVTVGHLFPAALGLHAVVDAAGQVVIETTAAAVLHALPLSTAVFGLSGFTFGMGSKTMNKLGSVADNIFMGTFFPGHTVEDHSHAHEYPALAPDSGLIQQNEKTIPIPQITREKSVMPAPPPPSMPAFVRDILAQKPHTTPIPKPASFALRHDQEVALNDTLRTV